MLPAAGASSAAVPISPLLSAKSRRSLFNNWRRLSSVLPSSGQAEVEDPEWIQIRQLCGGPENSTQRHPQEFAIQSWCTKHSVFLNFMDDSDYIQYRIFQRKTSLYPPLIPVLCIVIALDWISFGYDRSFEAGPFYFAAFFLFVVTNILFLPLFISECILSLRAQKGDKDCIFESAKNIFLAFDGHLESISCVSFALKFGMYLMAVVHEGECFGKSSRSLGGDSSDCSYHSRNIARSVQGVMKIGACIILTFLIPVGFQVCFKRVSRWAMLLSWIASTTFAIIAVNELPGSDRLLGFICPFSFIFLVISYENERFKISTFLQTRAISQNEFLKRQIVRQRANYALDMERVRHNNDMNLMEIQRHKEQSEKEQIYLRNLIGNVAHDLKTPLQSMAMGLETMLQALDDKLAPVLDANSNNTGTRDPGARPQSSSGKRGEKTDRGEEQHIEADSFSSEGRRLSGAQSLPVIGLGLQKVSFQPAPPAVYSSRRLDVMSDKGDKKIAAFKEIIPSLQASCSFMEMAINRALDFTKASNNIALVPKLEVFSVSEAIQKPVSSVVHLQAAGSVIVVEPLPRYISERIVSDKHWLCENILCLLSNAVKYSGGNPVRIAVDLIPVMVSQRTIVPIQRGMSVKADWVSLRGSAESSPFASSSTDSRRTSAKGRLSLIRIIVEDGGPGLTEAEQEKLFRSLDQGGRRTGGAGLGLYSLSKRLDALGGSYGVTSRADGKSGCAFWFAFPYEAAPTDLVVHKSVGLRTTLPSLDEERVLHMSPAALHLANVGSKLRVLVVDDAMSILKVTKMTLQKKGYNVDTANNGAIGLEKMMKSCDAWLKRDVGQIGQQKTADKDAGQKTAADGAPLAEEFVEEVDIVLMDLQMPVMDGFEAVRRFREYETERRNHHALKNNRKPLSSDDIAGMVAGDNGKKIPAGLCSLLIIGMSANSDDVSREEAKKAGMDFFLEKPFTISDFEHLLETIRAAFANVMSESQAVTPVQTNPLPKVLDVIAE